MRCLSENGSPRFTILVRKNGGAPLRNICQKRGSLHFDESRKRNGGAYLQNFRKENGSPYFYESRKKKMMGRIFANFVTNVAVRTLMILVRKKRRDASSQFS